MPKKISACCENCSRCTYIHEYEIYWCSKREIPIVTPQCMICDDYADKNGNS